MCLFFAHVHSPVSQEIQSLRWHARTVSSSKAITSVRSVRTHANLARSPRHVRGHVIETLTTGAGEGSQAVEAVSVDVTVVVILVHAMAELCDTQTNSVTRAVLHVIRTDTFHQLFEKVLNTSCTVQEGQQVGNKQTNEQSKQETRVNVVKEC